MRKYLKIILLFCCLCSGGIGELQKAFSQGPPPPGCDPTDPAGGTDVCPIDGNLAMLLLAGVGYGVKKYGSFKAEKKNIPSN